MSKERYTLASVLADKGFGIVQAGDVLIPSANDVSEIVAGLAEHGYQIVFKDGPEPANDLSMFDRYVPTPAERAENERHEASGRRFNALNHATGMIRMEPVPASDIVADAKAFETYLAGRLDEPEAPAQS